MLSFLSVACGLAAAPTGVRQLGLGRVAPRSRPALMMAVPLRSWLETEAGVSAQFLDKVVATCDEEMIGSVENLRTLGEAGMLISIFKPVIAASIESALQAGGGGGGVAHGGATALDGGARQLPLPEVKKRLRANLQSTWGTGDELRRRLSMFAIQDKLKVAPVEAVSFPPTLTPPGPPPPPNGPVNMGGVARAPAPAAATAPPPPPPPPAAAPAPVAAAPAAAAPPPPASDKSTFTVKLVTPDGELQFECPPEQFILDQTDEEEGEGFANLPYACRAGSCSACAGKLVSGTVDGSAGSFLSDEQRAAGFVLTCTAKPTSDCVIQTHVEEELF